jgi:8-oxo-dGTP pyrophosphatase MutT (NUDIX family)
MTTTIEDIRQRLAGRTPRLLTDDSKTQAAVALVLHQGSDALRLLFIERSKREGDPWSGHIAFPGGKVEACDRDPRSAAERETLEEIGLDLGGATYLGRFDDLTGLTLPVLVSGFVFAVEKPGALVLNDEVREAFWRTLEELADAERWIEHRVHYGGADHVHAAIDVLGPGRPLLWGLTYRFVVQLLQLAGCAVQQTEDR